MYIYKLSGKTVAGTCALWPRGTVCGQPSRPRRPRTSWPPARTARLSFATGFQVFPRRLAKQNIAFTVFVLFVEVVWTRQCLDSLETHFFFFSVAVLL